jgi:hypothetical protein
MMSVTASLRSAAGEFGKQRLAEFGAALAAILCEEEHEAAECIDVGALDVLTSALFGLNQSSLGEHRQMRGEGALRQSSMFDELPCR